MNTIRRKFRKIISTLILEFVVCMVYGIVYADMVGMRQKKQELVTLQPVITEVTVFPVMRIVAMFSLVMGVKLACHKGSLHVHEQTL
jgi:hypothetical protein